MNTTEVEGKEAAPSMVWRQAAVTKTHRSYDIKFIRHKYSAYIAFSLIVFYDAPPFLLYFFYDCLITIAMQASEKVQKEKYQFRKISIFIDQYNNHKFDDFNK